MTNIGQMQIVDPKALKDGEFLKPPGWCVFTHDIDGPFLDTGININEIDPRGYVHVPFVEAMGRAVGMVPKYEVDALKERLDAMEESFNEVSKQLDAIRVLDPGILGVSNGSS